MRCACVVHACCACLMCVFVVRACAAISLVYLPPSRSRTHLNRISSFVLFKACASCHCCRLSFVSFTTSLYRSAVDCRAFVYCHAWNKLLFVMYAAANVVGGVVAAAVVVGVWSLVCSGVMFVRACVCVCACVNMYVCASLCITTTCRTW